jgi:predicted  nucleic acid-binding Zn-ribbon protein
MTSNVTIVEGGIDFSRFEPVETIETETDTLRIEKRVAKTDVDRAIVDLRAEATDEEVVGAWFVDPLPPTVDSGAVHAHDDVDPSRWSFTEDGHLRFEVVVDPDESRSVGYVVTEMSDVEPLSNPPRVAEIQTMGPAESTAANADAMGDSPRGTTDQGANGERPESIASKVREALSVPAESRDERSREPEADAPERNDLEFEFRSETDSSGDASEVIDFDDESEPSEDEFQLERSAGGTDDRSTPAVESTTDAAADDAEPTEADGGADSEEALLRGSGASTVEEPSPAEQTVVTPEEVPSVFVTQLRSGALSEEELDALRDALGIGMPRSTTTRIEHVESRLTEFEAYIDALEAFIDDNGTADEVIENLESTVQDLTETVEAVEEELEGIRTQQAELRGAIDDHGDELSVVGDRVDAVEAKLDELESTADGQGARIDDLETGQAELRSDLEESRAELRSDMEEGREDLRSTLEERRQELRSDLTDDREELQSDIEASIDDVESEVERLSTRFDSIESSWRKVKDAFGGD